MLCDELGSGWAVQEACGASQYCEDGACHDQVCPPGQVYCDGDLLKTCDELGKEVLDEVDCGADELFCFAGECQELVCQPFSYFCEDVNTQAHCDETGMEFQTTECGEGTFCDSGACVPWICTPLEVYCEDNAVKICSDDGDFGMVISACGEDICWEGECLELACPPGQDFCVDPGTLGACNDEGTDFDQTACGEGTWCDGGACVPWVCTPGEPVCDGILASTCDEYGAGPLPGGEDCAEAGGCCQAGECVEAVTEVCDDQDNDCDGKVDEGCDDDNDGWCDDFMQVVGVPAVCDSGLGDCDDQNPGIFPGAVENPVDEVDNNCNGEVDEDTVCAGECTGHTVEAYLCALELCLGETVVNAAFSSPTNDNIAEAWEAVAHFGSPENDLAPKAGGSYGLLSSGTAAGTSHSKDLPGGGAVADPYSNDGYQTYDNVEFTLTLVPPPWATGFSIDYIFFSVEYEEYIGTSFNDKFYILLNGTETTGGNTVVINYTPCSNPSSYYDLIDDDGNKKCYIAINTAFSEPCSNPSTNIAGTGFECGPPDAQHGSSTGWLRTSWGVVTGDIVTLTFHIHDASDGIFDSEVILDNFKWLGGAFEAGTVSIP